MQQLVWRCASVLACAPSLQVEQDAQDRMVEQVLRRPGGRPRRLMPSGSSQARGPMPERCSTAGEWIAPAHSSTSRRARTLRLSPPTVTRTPLACGAIALECQAVDDRRCPTIGEVGPAARRLEIAVVGRDAQARAAVDGVGRDAGAFRRVVVGAPAIAEGETRLHHRAVDMAPCLDRRAIDRDRARPCRDTARRRSRRRSRACGSREARRPSPSRVRPRAPSPRNRRGCRGSRSGR